MLDGTGVMQPSPVPLGVPGVRRTLSAPLAAGATMLPPSMPSLPQVRDHVDAMRCRVAMLMLDVSWAPAKLSFPNALAHHTKCNRRKHQVRVLLPSN